MVHHILYLGVMLMYCAQIQLINISICLQPQSLGACHNDFFKVTYLLHLKKEYSKKIIN